MNWKIYSDYKDEKGVESNKDKLMLSTSSNVWFVVVPIFSYQRKGIFKNIFI